MSLQGDWIYCSSTASELVIVKPPVPYRESILVVWPGSLFRYLFFNILLRSGCLVLEHDIDYSFPAKTNSFEITR